MLYLPNGYLNTVANFNFERLVRSETLSCIFTRLGSKGSKQLVTLQKLVCTFLYQMGIQIYDQISTPRIWSKVKLRHSIPLRFGLKEVKMVLRNWKQMQLFRPWFHQVFLRSKIARNPLKVCMYGYLSNGRLNSLSNVNYNKAKNITSLRPLLDQP